MYRDPELLVVVVARWCQQGLVRGEAALVIATPAHRAAFAQRLRALGAKEGGATPAVALTAYGRTHDRVLSLTAGYDMHVPKPVDPG